MKLRLLLRDIIATSLRLLPLRWLDKLRNPRDFGKASGLCRQSRRRVLRILRHRRLDASIASFCPPDRPDVCFNNVDSVLMRRLYWLGQSGYEATESLCWEYCCSKSRVILEIGANVGLYTVFGARAAAADSRYTAVEPLSANFAALGCNVKLNDLKNVDLIQAAVVGEKKSETAELLIPTNDRDANPAGAFLASVAEARGHRARASETVRLIEASEIFEGVDLIKLDVEGSEYDILHGMTHRILKEQPTLFIEIFMQAKRLRKLLVKWCEAARFRVFVPADDGLVEITPDHLGSSDLQQQFGTRDVIMSTKHELISGLYEWLKERRDD